jgi:excalibur calcium-binding domain-containing protein
VPRPPMNPALRLALCIVGGLVCWYVAISALTHAQLDDTAPGTTPTPTTPVSVYYSSCQDAHDAHDTPLYRGRPGYRAELDPDNDGTACT